MTVTAIFAAKFLFVIQVLAILFHSLVLAGIFPYDIVWGGRVNSVAQMQKMETVSILITAMIAMLTAIYLGWLPPWISYKLLGVLLWLLCALFILNTIGNTMAINKLEMLIFTPITALSSIALARMAFEPNYPKMP